MLARNAFLIIVALVFVALFHGQLAQAQEAAYPTCTFSANPNIIQAGGLSKLSWTTTNATSFVIDHGFGSMSVASGLAYVMPLSTTIYTGTASGPGGVAMCTVAVVIPDSGIDKTPPDRPANVVRWQIDAANGWTMLGNPTNREMSVAELFGALGKSVVDSDGNSIPGAFTSIWKWFNGGWEFYSPLLSAEGNDVHAASHGMNVLKTIKPGDGFWVNAVGSHRFPEIITEENAGFYADFQMRLNGWQQIGPPHEANGRELNQQLSSTLAANGAAPTTDITTLWGWDSYGKKWTFYAPSLDVGDDNVLYSYADAHGYNGGTYWNFRPGDGIFANKKSTPVLTVEQ